VYIPLVLNYPCCFRTHSPHMHWFLHGSEREMNLASVSFILTTSVSVSSINYRFEPEPLKIALVTGYLRNDGVLIYCMMGISLQFWGSHSGVAENWSITGMLRHVNW
jgi:hypothetical protein